MQCPNCQEEVNPQSGFCHRCGKRLDMDDAAQETAGSETAEASPGASISRATSSSSAGHDDLSPAVRAMGNRGSRDDDVELELWRGAYSPKAMIGAWIGTALVTVAIFIVGVMWAQGSFWWSVILLGILALWGGQLLLLLYRRLNARYRLTNQRFVHERGILRRVTDRIEVIDMDDISFEQGIFERLMGVGTIKIVSSDRTHPELVILGIEEVKDVSGKMDDARREERIRRGLHIEAV